jgi:pentatricopeptide repeat-containing protein PET309
MRTPEGAPLALTDIVNELRDAVGETDRSEMASKDPFFNPGGGDELLSSFASIIFIHGKRRCMEAVQLLLTVYKDMQDYSEEGHLPMRVISALMNAHLEFKDYPAVTEYLELAIAEADRITALMPVPNFVLLAPEKEDSAEDVAKKDRHPSTPDHEAIGAEVGFPAGVPSSSPPAVPAAATTDVVNDPTVAPGLDYILSTPLTYQIKAVAAQNRITTILGTFTSLVRRGYVFDAITWNTLVQALCASDPPLVLLAFTLTERFLIDQFAGWTTSRGERNYRPRPEPKRSGLQYMRARYLPFDRLVPHYKTMVHLASAFTKLQTIETMGGVNDIPDVVRFVGTVKKVEESAPKTMMAIRELPVVRSDRLQQRLLSREDGW